MSDHDNAFRQAAAAIFPQAQLQLCTWHVVENVKRQILKDWVSQGNQQQDTIAQAAFLAGFEELVYKPGIEGVSNLLLCQ